MGQHENEHHTQAGIAECYICQLEAREGYWKGRAFDLMTENATLRETAWKVAKSAAATTRERDRLRGGIDHVLPKLWAVTEDCRTRGDHANADAIAYVSRFLASELAGSQEEPDAEESSK